MQRCIGSPRKRRDMDMHKMRLQIRWRSLCSNNEARSNRWTFSKKQLEDQLRPSYVRSLIGKASAIVRLRLPSERKSSIIQRALKPEAEASLSHRSKVQVKREGRTLTLIFESADTTALRASVNSYLSWLQLLNDVYGALESHRSWDSLCTSIKQVEYAWRFALLAAILEALAPRVFLVLWTASRIGGCISLFSSWVLCGFLLQLSFRFRLRGFCPHFSQLTICVR